MPSLAAASKTFHAWLARMPETTRSPPFASDLAITGHASIRTVENKLASADEDLWADPKGEYASLLAAGPVFELFGLKHITNPEMPPLNTPRHAGSTGYHIRTGVHNLTEQDWGYFLDFADGVFKR